MEKQIHDELIKYQEIIKDATLAIEQATAKISEFRVSIIEQSEYKKDQVVEVNIIEKETGKKIEVKAKILSVNFLPFLSKKYLNEIRPFVAAIAELSKPEKNILVPYLTEQQKADIVSLLEEKKKKVLEKYPYHNAFQTVYRFEIASNVELPRKWTYDSDDTYNKEDRENWFLPDCIIKG